MELTFSWFALLASVCMLALVTGECMGAGSRVRIRVGVLIGIILLLLWGWLMYRPAVAVHLIPASVLRYLEGTAAVPLFMFLVGITRGACRTMHFRRISVVATSLGGAMFVHSGFWMLQTTPQIGLADTVATRVVAQSTDFSCVAAASATALNFLGLPTTEAYMAELTDTRPGSGATTIRALDGLRIRLRGTPFDVQLLEPHYDQIIRLPAPMLVTLREDTNASYNHMVTVLSARGNGVIIADPSVGTRYLRRADFEKVYQKQALVFERR